MAVIFFPDEKGNIVHHSTIEEAKVGRWCLPPEVPDHCYVCFYLNDDKLPVHYKAEGFITNEQNGWRYGICHRCHPELISTEGPR